MPESSILRLSIDAIVSNGGGSDLPKANLTSSPLPYSQDYDQDLKVSPTVASHVSAQAYPFFISLSVEFPFTAPLHYG